MTAASIGLANFAELTRPRSTGRLVNPHVIPYRKSPKPNYDLVKESGLGKSDEGPKDDNQSG